MSLQPHLHKNALLDYPNWAKELHYPYWIIRNEGRNKAKRRKAYRQVSKIKLKLVEQGHDINEINKICRYLANHSYTAKYNYENNQNDFNKQLCLPFF
jgi:hypothetical protein